MLSGILLALTTVLNPCPEHRLALKKVTANYCEYVGHLVQPDPLAGFQRKIPFTYYFSRNASPRGPLVLVYPSLSNEIPIVETLFSKKLVENGFHALVLELVEDISELDRHPTTINDFFVRSNWGTRKIVDFVSKWPEIDENNINAAGVSLGGIRATLAFGDDLRINRLITYVSGGNLPAIFATSTVKMVSEYREHWKAKLGIPTDEEFSKYLSKILWIDPTNVGTVRSNRNIFMVLARKDQKVPFKNQLELWNALGQPAHRIGNFAHRLTGASFLTQFDEVLFALNKPLK